MIRAFLFDLDETITDAQRGIERAIEAVALRAAEFLRPSMPLERIRSELWRIEIERSIKRSYDRNEWWRELALRLNAEPFSGPQLSELTEIYWSTFTRFNRPFPDAEPTLRHLRSLGFKLALVTDTDGTPGLKRTRISSMPILRFFDSVVVAGEDTLRPKPDPEPFLLAASQLGVGPSECVVVGDKPYTDIRGGKAAGMLTVRVFRRRWRDEEPADYTIESLGELLDLLPRLIRQS
jgi:putative hydrolase of the HAD superfamily